MTMAEDMLQASVRKELFISRIGHYMSEHPELVSVMYVGPDGKFSAHPTLAGTDAIGLIDKAGNPIGQQIMVVAKNAEVSEVEYVWNRPGETTPTGKVAYAIKIGDQICAVGYYK